MFDYRKYVAFNDAIFDYFFNADRADQLTTLSFDDDATSQIGEEFSLTGRDFVHELSMQVRSVVNLNSDDPFRFWTRHSQRESTALLASEVFVISRLGTNAAGSLEHQGFHSAFNRDVLGLEDSEPVAGLKSLDELWKRFERYLRVDERGSLGRIAFLEVIKYKHINYPASQCFVRVSDRRRLHSLFQRHFNPEHPFQKCDLSGIFAEDTTGLSVMFRRAFEQLDNHPDLANGFWSIVEGEYKVWQAEPAQVERIARSKSLKKAGGRVSTTSSAADIRRNNPALHDYASSPIEERQPRVRMARELSPLQLLESRLILIQPHRRSAELLIEARVPAEGGAAFEAMLPHDGWVRIDRGVDAEMFEEGFESILGTFRIRRSGSTLMAFESGDLGWVETNVLRLGRPLRFVCSLAFADFLKPLRDVATNFEVLSIEPDDLACYAMTLPPDVEIATLPQVMQETLSGPQTRIALSSGLRLRNGMYLYEGPPLVTFVHHTTTAAEVLLDEVCVGTAQRDIAFRLPPTTWPGRHVISILDQRRSFIVSDPQIESELVADSPESFLGFVVANHPPRLDTNLEAEMLRIDDLSKMSAVVVVGADLLLPYRRFAE